MAQSDIDQTQGCGWLFLLAIAAIIAWFGYSCFYAPSHRTRLAEPALADPWKVVVPIDSPEADITSAVAAELPGVTFQLEEMEGGNLNIYLSRRHLDGIPYANRSDSIERIGSAWCQHVDVMFAPSVRVRDSATGDSLASFSCLTNHASLSR